MAGNVCKFFLQGRCKFGDRCRFRHPTNTGGGGGGYRHQPDPSFDTGRRWDTKPDSNRFHLFSDTTHNNSNGGHGGSDWGRSSNRGGREWNNRGGRNSWDNQRSDYRGQSSSYRGQSSSYRGQSSSYRGQSSSYRGTGYSDSRYGSGGRSSQYGNRNYESHFQNQFDKPYQSSNRYPPQEQTTLTDPSEIAAQIQSDMEEWKNHMLWPMSCYAYHKETPCLPGFTDLSPEEVRWEAYQSKTKGTSEQYLKLIRELSDEHLKTLNMYSRTTADDVERLKSGQLPSSPLFGSQGGGAVGSDFFAPSANAGSTVSSFFGSSSPLQNSASLFGSNTQSQPLLQQNNQTLTPITAVNTAIASSPSVFTTQQTAQSSSASQQTPLTQTLQQPLPSTATATVSSTTASGTVAMVKTDQLTKEDLKAFKADKFILGHIPEHFPSKELC